MYVCDIEDGGGKGGPGREEFGGREAGVAAELAGEVTLVVVAGGEGGIDERGAGMVEEIEEAAQAKDAAQRTRRDAHAFGEAALELAAADVQFLREGVDRTFGVVEPGDALREDRAITRCLLYTSPSPRDS